MAQPSARVPWPLADTPIEPFWQRVPRFFRFPAHRAPLLRNLAVSALLALTVASGLLPAVLLATLLALVVMARYGFLVIERASHGHLDPRRYPQRLDDSGKARPYKMFAVFLIAGLAVEVVTRATGSRFLAFAVNAVVALAVPASVMVMTMSDSLAQSLDPRRLLRVALAIGKPYFALFGFLLLLIAGSDNAFALVAPLFPERLWLLLGLSTFVGNYFFLIMCALIGYVMYQYHDALGLTVSGPAAGGGGAGESARTRDALIAQMVTHGEVADAIRLIEDELRERPHDLALNGRLQRLLRMGDDPVRAAEHAQRHLRLLLDSGNDAEALSLVHEWLAADPHWQPRDAADVVPLARAALQAGRLETTAALLRGFDRRHPGHPAIATVYLLAAQLQMASGAPEQALRVLEAVRSRFAGTAEAEQAGRLARVLIDDTSRSSRPPSAP